LPVAFWAGRGGGAPFFDAPGDSLAAEGAVCLAFEGVPTGEPENEGQRKSFFFRGCGVFASVALSGVSLSSGGKDGLPGNGGGLFFVAGVGA